MKNLPRKVSLSLWRSSAPESLEDLQRLWALGIRNIICLQEGWSWKFFKTYRAKDAWERKGGRYWTVGWSNFFSPTMDDCEILFRLVRNPDVAGDTLVHCKAGVDRTGWFCARWLLSIGGFMTPAFAWHYAKANGMHLHYRLFWKRAFFKQYYEWLDRIVKSES